MPQAFAYLHVSGKGRVDGFPGQLAAVKAYAEKDGFTLSRVFREESVSGTQDLENRPALLELMEALKTGRVKTVLIEKLDRLARDLMVQETIIGDLRRHGYELTSVAEPGLLQADPTRTLLRQMLGAIAQYEKAMIVLKLRGPEGV